MMPINPLQAIQMLRCGANPNQLMMQIAQNNPAVQQAMRAVNGKTPDQIRDMAQQMARQRGVDLNQLARQLGVQLPR